MNTAPSFTRIAIAYAGFLLVWTALQTYILVDLGLGYKQALVDAVFTHVLFALSSFIVYITLANYQPTRENSFYMRIWGVLLAVGNTMVIYQGLKYAFGNDEDYLKFLNRSIPIRFAFQVLMLMTLLLLQWLWNTMAEQRELYERQQEAERHAREAELYNIRQQLNPHFLFNSLNSISALAGSRPEEARNMIQQLSEFLRHTLRKDDAQRVSLREELTHLNLYLEIEKVRFGNRLRTQFDIDEKCLDRLVPVLLLQPLLENAIKFGLYDTLGEVLIEVKAKCVQGGRLEISVSNPFDVQTHRQHAGTGFGLDMVRRRLYLLYADNQLLETSQENGIFSVFLRIPGV